MRKSIGVLLFVLSILVSCEEVEVCSDSQLKDREQLQQSFKDLHRSDVTLAEIENFKFELSTYLSSYEDKKCKSGEKEIHEHEEIKSMVDEIESMRFSMITPKVIYGDDDRVEVALSTPTMQKLARSVAAMIKEDKIDELGNLPTKTLGESFGLCSDQRFSDQINPASCSGFLVGEDILVTAGHCITNRSDCSNNVWVFDFHEGVTNVEQANTYKCKEIIERDLSSSTENDYAVIRLDRKVTDRAALRFRREGKVSDSNPVFVIGHPSGLPAKVATGAVVRDNSKDVYFSTNLDTFAGNSGSPVFNEVTGVVEGILVRGETDYKYVNREDGTFCREVFTCSEEGCRGEDVTRITRVNGLPDSLVPNESEVFKELFDVEKLLDTESHLLAMNQVKASEYSMSGRSFLEVCVSHLYHLSTPKVWEDAVQFSCEDKDQLSPLYESFKLKVD